MANPPYRSGDHWVICSICGGRLFHSQSKKNWEGLICHPNCCDSRHPQELIKARKDNIAVKDARPEEFTYISPGDVTRDDL